MCGGTGNFEQMKKLESKGVITEAERKGMSAGNGGKLSPEWVELLMGWPLNWTTLDDEAEKWFKPVKGKTPKAACEKIGPLLADPWGPTWEDGVPRVVTEIAHRVDRLRLTGNGVVPQQSAVAWARIKELAEGVTPP